MICKTGIFLGQVSREITKLTKTGYNVCKFALTCVLQLDFKRTGVPAFDYCPHPRWVLSYITSNAVTVKNYCTHFYTSFLPPSFPFGAQHYFCLKWPCEDGHDNLQSPGFEACQAVAAGLTYSGGNRAACCIFPFTNIDPAGEGVAGGGQCEPFWNVPQTVDECRLIDWVVECCDCVVLLSFVGQSPYGYMTP